MIRNLLFLVLAGPLPSQERCPRWAHETSVEDLQKLRRIAYDEAWLDDLLVLVEWEVEARREEICPSEPPEEGSLSELCGAVEAAFNACSHHRPDSRCSTDYLQRYVTEGCLDDPAQVARYFAMQSVYWRTQVNYARALSSLATAEDLATRAFLRHFWREDGAGVRLAMDALLDLVIAVGWRADLAGQLRNSAAAAEQVARLEVIFDTLQAFSERAAALLERHSGDDSDPFGVRTIIANTKVQVGWALLLMQESRAVAGDPVPWLTSALETYTSGPRKNRFKADNVRINLALSALHRGDTEAVERHIGEIDLNGQSDEEILWLRLIQVRAALARGDYPLAETWLHELDRIAALGQVPMGRWYAAWGRGLYSDAVGLGHSALRAYAEADAILEEHVTTRRPGPTERSRTGVT